METTDTHASATPGGRIASRLWTAARTEFATRGYHGARVQGIAKRAGCNVALLYRHWASKRALYVEILKTIWQEGAKEIGEQVDGTGGARGVVSAYLELRMKDPEASQIVIRELLDGGPFLREIVASDPSVLAPTRRLADVLRAGNGHGLRAGVDPEMAVLTVAGFAALVGAAHESAQALFPGGSPSADAWKTHVSDLLLHGLEAS
ncbi:MAG TPA: TetR/AcrR family transcriptional regulator [Anaeromyxobacteraceae bacterium]|nr:TetR/AcrR family transcriptional regulator [Anaeromyxobacteraceae bacterium]